MLCLTKRWLFLLRIADCFVLDEEQVNLAGERKTRAILEWLIYVMMCNSCFVVCMLMVADVCENFLSEVSAAIPVA